MVEEKEREYLVLDVIFDVLYNYKNNTGSTDDDLNRKIHSIMNDAHNIQDTLKKLFYILQEMIMEDFDDLPIEIFDALKVFVTSDQSHKELYYAYEICQVILFLQYLSLHYKIIISQHNNIFSNVFKLVFNWPVANSELYFLYIENTSPIHQNTIPIQTPIPIALQTLLGAAKAGGGNKKRCIKPKCKK
jgi:hypothetical protein